MAVDKPDGEELEQRVKFLEKELAEYKRGETAYRSMVESTADSLYMVDRDCRYLFVNSRHLTARINLPSGQVIGRHYGDFHTPEKSAEFADLVNEVFTRGVSIQQEHNSTRDGRHFLRTISPVREPGSPDRITGVIIVSKDITERKLVEDALRRSEKLHREFINASRPMIFLKDEQSRYLLVNTPFLEFLGKKEEEVIGKTDFELMSGEMGDKCQEVCRKVLESGAPVSSEEIIADRVYEIRLFPVELSDGRPGINGRVIDITDNVQADKEKKKLAAQLIQSQKMEAIGTLAGGIAHDFNNLLMGIQGYASLMLFNLDAGHPFYEKLKHIERQVQSGAALTKQLLGFARGGKYEVKTTDLNEVIARTAAMFGRTKKEITIHQNYQPDLWMAEVDRGQIEQVLMNLYVNAWQAMPGGGCLYLETHNVELDETYVRHYFVKPGRYVKITVADAGVGMDECVRARLFEPFFTTKEMGRGTGLGLAVVYGIVKAHDGFINVYSEKGQGTLFKIYFPVSDKNKEEEKIPPQELLRGTETILLVDDEEMVAKVTREVLEALGYRVLSAKSGKEAIDIYIDHGDEISLVILDMIMPGMGGGETFDILKKIDPDVAVMLSSGYSLNHQAIDIMKRGCRMFMQKPFSVGDLSRTIREILAENGK